MLHSPLRASAPPIRHVLRSRPSIVAPSTLAVRTPRPSWPTPLKFATNSGSHGGLSLRQVRHHAMQARTDGLFALYNLRQPLDVRAFHATRKNEGLPVIAILSGIFKASTGIETARMVARIALTFAPLIVLKNMKVRHYLKKNADSDRPDVEAKRDALLQSMRRRTFLLHALIFTPVFLFWMVIMGSLERTPLTGRWRAILLSPEEEDDIATQLAGEGWYRAVSDILSQDGPPRIISPTDWRYSWVTEVLRRLESTIPTLQREREMQEAWLDISPDDLPLPPPAEYPLRGRPRATAYLRSFCEAVSQRLAPPVSHSLPGAPYSLLLVEDPESSNAFSYGFGPDGGGGIVVYSGFLDEILAKTPVALPVPEPQEPSWWSYLFGGFGSISPPSPPHPMPTPEQTSELAILLAHELAHLVLSHHLETLSSSTIVVPGILSVVSDFVRALIFPVTMLFGPFVNDAVAQLGKMGSVDLARIGEYCTSFHQELEADVVSTRLLAYAGFDARDAVRFWENRSETPRNAECSPGSAREAPAETATSTAASLVRRIAGSGHPVNETRVLKLREEVQRWETERRRVLAERRASAEAA